MAAAGLKPLPDPNLPWSSTTTGRPAPPFAEFMQSMEKLLKGGAIGPLTNAANDAAAAAAGVPIGALYANAGAVRIRLT